METVQKPNLDLNSMDGGDLGLGKGLKPGGIPITNGDSDSQETSGSADELDSLVKNFEIINGCESTTSDIKEENKEHVKKLSKLAEKFKWLRRSKSEPKVEPIPLTLPPGDDEVPIGTSLRQQKKLFSQNCEDLFHKQDDTTDVKVKKEEVKDKSFKVETKTKNEEAEEKLRRAEKDVENLVLELTLCKKQLDAKVKAIRLIQKQSLAAQNQESGNTKKVKELNQTLTQEINSLQFELECRQSRVMDSQQLWATRFDRVCQENSHLASALEAKTDEMRRVKAEKMSICRERDELLALLDVQERQRYEGSRSTTSEDEYYNFTSNELAILGACHCRVQEPDPCVCAHAASRGHKEILRLKEELATHKQRREEALVTADAYRIAFEEQLARNRGLVKQVAHLTAFPPPPSTATKAKAAVRWLIKQINEDTDILPLRRLPEPVYSMSKPPGVATESTQNLLGSKRSSDSSTKSSPNSPEDDSHRSLENSEQTNTPGDHNMNSMQDDELVDKDESELIDMFLEMITDKTEALAHQRLAARMLANRTKELEKKLTAATNGPEDVFTKEEI